MTFWDSLEHIARPEVLLSKVTGQTVFISTPIYTDAEDCIRSKHFKPKEHYWYWTDWGLRGWLRELGFAVVKSHERETDAGREAIGTYVAKRSTAV